MAGLVPAISLREASPALLIGIAGTSPAMTVAIAFLDLPHPRR